MDASVARAADGSTVLALVNLDPQRPARVQTNLTGTVRGRMLTAGAAAAPLTLELPPKSVVVVSVMK